MTSSRITSHCNLILGHCVPKLALALKVNSDPSDDLCTSKESQKSQKKNLHILNPNHAPSTEVYLHNGIMTSPRITSTCNKILGQCPKLGLCPESQS